MLNRFKEKSLAEKFLYIFLLVGVIVFSYARASKESDAGDFHVFWLAGKTLLSGGDIYYVPPGLRNFIYPPFAALFFSPLSFLPFKIATFLFFIINFSLVYFSFVFIKKILELFYQDKKVIRFAIIFSLVITFKLCWNNIMMIQANQLVFLFTVLGIYYFLKKRENLSVMFFCLAISLKIFPILFAFWVLLRGSKTVLLKFILGGLICIALPMMFSGVSFGISQLDWYLHNFLLKVSSPDALNLSYANQSLSGTLGRMFTTLHDANEPVYTIVNLGLEKTKLMTMLIKLGIVASMFFVLSFSRIKKFQNNLIEPTLIIAVIHLISGVTWKAHLVSFSLIFAYIGADAYRRRKSLTIFDYVSLVYFLAIALLGQVIVGRKGQLYMNGWGDYTLVMLLCFTTIMISFFRECRSSHLNQVQG